jgi:hypothetical protein
MNIEGYPNYFVTSCGEIFSKATNRKLVKSVGSNGYETVTLCRDNTRKTHSVHKLVALAWIPKVSGKEYINHKNGIKTDNSLENLEWCTQSDNIRHSISTGLANVAKGSAVAGSKLTEEDIPIIRKLLVDGFNDREVGELFGVGRKAISSIRQGKSWRHV